MREEGGVRGHVPSSDRRRADEPIGAREESSKEGSRDWGRNGGSFRGDGDSAAVLKKGSAVSQGK